MCEEIFLIFFILSQEFVYHQLPHGIYLCIFFLSILLFFYFFLMDIKNAKISRAAATASVCFLSVVVWFGDGLSEVRVVFIPPLHAQLADDCVYFSWYLTAARLTMARRRPSWKRNPGNGETLSDAMTLKTQRWQKKESENKKSLNINVLVFIPRNSEVPPAARSRAN